MGGQRSSRHLCARSGAFDGLFATYQRTLGIDFDKVDLVNGDTALSPSLSVGTFGSRSASVGGMGILKASQQIIEKGKRIAAHLLQAQPDHVSFERGAFKTETSSISIEDVAKAAYDPNRLPDGMELGLDEDVRNPS